MKILLVEDDVVTRDYVESGLIGAGHLVDATADGVDGLTLAARGSYGAIILDRMLPGMDGLAILKAIRAAGSIAPVLFLTAIGGIDDRVEGLEAGADDYLVKPFAFSELAARLAAIARRPARMTEQTKLTVGDLEMDLVRRAVMRGGIRIELLAKEFALLEYFMRSEGRVLSKTMLLEHVWDFNFDPQTSVVETHISRLRAKIDKPFETELLHTIKNVGYTLRA
ncbi:MAG: response regulator [Hyphomonas sp.]|uniref:winged helix-turn-helix domain-containing protein n=1 Tax=Hyphomonas sp. TaxID=87 RepID=UPI0005F0F8FE|nr:winged helix-turn-helix domain-containing protein [Hyphomonas sp.]KJS28061.1 MAG: XRE family transcriptional regulator [Hyphomonadaceae bacterium BRH_c29]MBU3921249.1 winged helix-turn-helix domain-containing protein [Alphaproteobacteria bacterium]MBA3070199.1 response regulator [Hyphomonas sp.]MBU4060225.1 winged helix-turn-helix domain-containing protein [Alphaproteobacteria bacterium]MBU4162893.1 winged helix-turn-helix domain-containing protein [Alphaproteobacteria bacterium]